MSTSVSASLGALQDLVSKSEEASMDMKFVQARLGEELGKLLHRRLRFDMSEKIGSTVSMRKLVWVGGCWVSQSTNSFLDSGHIEGILIGWEIDERGTAWLEIVPQPRKKDGGGKVVRFQVPVKFNVGIELVEGE